MTKYYQTDGRRVARGRVTPKEQVKRVPVASEEEGLPVWALPKSVQLSLADLAGTVKEGLLAFAVATGFEVMYTMMDADVEALCGPNGRHEPARSAYRHGTDDGELSLGGRRVAVRRPRVRSADGKKELPLPTYEAFSSADGTFLRDESSGTIWRTAGGAALDISSCTPIGGCRGAINIDPADVQNAGGEAPWGHLSVSPSDGTVVEAMPSARYWVFKSGNCFASSSPSASAVQVDDASVSCVTPPSAPTNLVAIPGSNSVSLSWQPPSVDNGAPVTAYGIYRSTTAGLQGSVCLERKVMTM